MKKIKLLLGIVLAVMTTAGASAQNTFFPAKTGTVLIYAQNNASGKADSYMRYTVKNVEGSGKNMTIMYVVEALDKNQKPADPPVETPCKVVIRDGVMILDMTQMFAGQQMEGVKMEITGTPVELPDNLQPGQSIKDANMTMTADMGFMKMQTATKMTGGKCLAIEDVKVAAGVFKCHKITQTVTTTVMNRDVATRTVTWLAPGIGTVKTETYDDKDKLLSSMELIKN